MLNATTYNHKMLSKCATYVYFKNQKVLSVNVPIENFLVKNRENRDLDFFFVVDQNLNIFYTQLIQHISLSLWVLCQNLSKNEAKLLILWHIPFLRVLARKFWFNVWNAPCQNGNRFWTKLARTVKFCQDVPYMHISKVK